MQDLTTLWNDIYNSPIFDICILIIILAYGVLIWDHLDIYSGWCPRPKRYWWRFTYPILMPIVLFLLGYGAIWLVNFSFHLRIQ